MVTQDSTKSAKNDALNKCQVVKRLTRSMDNGTVFVVLHRK